MPSYDPFAGSAPLAPRTYTGTSSFRFGDFTQQRRYNAVDPQGAYNVHFDAEDHPVSERVASRLLADGMPGYTENDVSIEEEADAAYVPQPREAQNDLRNDIRNDRVQNLIHGITTRSENPSAPLQRHRELATEEPARAVVLSKALAKAARDTNVDPDFFTSIVGYEPAQPCRSDMSRVERAANDDNLIAVLDQEIKYLIDEEAMADNDAVGEQDAADAREERDQRRAELEAEKAELLAAIETDEGDSEDTDDASDAKANKERRQREIDFTVTDIGVEEAEQLLDNDPFTALPVAMRAYFMQFPEAQNIWRLMRPLTLQHEEHRRHYNIDEIVRAMCIQGAKYDGHVRVRVPANLSSLINPEFYGPFLSNNGRLRGGHEHLHNGYTTMTVIKFYIVRKTKAAIETAQKSNTATVETAKATAAQPRPIIDESNKDVAGQVETMQSHMILNKPGLYDTAARDFNLENDGTDEYGTLHSIKYLPREFMFSVRIVCVETTATDEKVHYVSEDDNDYELPPEYNNFEKDEASVEQSMWSINDGATGSVWEVGSDEEKSAATTTTTTTGARRRHANDDDDNDADNAFDTLEHQAAFVHSDDDDDPDEKVYQMLLAQKPFMPPAKLHLTLDQAEHLVGTHKAPDFQRRVNNQVSGALCVRSFLFYTGANQ